MSILSTVTALLRGAFAQKIEPEYIPPRIPDIDHRSIIAEYVQRSGLTKGRDQDVNFYVAAFESDQLNYDCVRKIGTPLSPAQKRGAGIKFRGILTAEFLDTLNDTGMLDPVETAGLIAAPAFQACSTAEHLRQPAALSLFVDLHPSCMLAGPCSACTVLAREKLPACDAPLLPLPDCTHPDQCACFYQAVLPW